MRTLEPGSILTFLLVVEMYDLGSTLKSLRDLSVPPNKKIIIINAHENPQILAAE